jgi:hypothetical protein
MRQFITKAAAFAVMKNPGASPEVSSLERKFIVLAGAIPRSEDRFTTFLTVTNSTEASLGVWTPAFQSVSFLPVLQPDPMTAAF